LSVKLSSKKSVRSSTNLLLAIPLILSAFTHLWNPIGFPSIYVDEGHYMRRAIQVLEGIGHQESPNQFNEYHSYDHPYFGQIFLAFIFRIIDYPSSLNPKPGDISSIQKLYFVPRVFMGLLAIIDTFLVYKIAERRYNRNVALVASILFAVMPMTWLLRRILLEPIQLPFLLSSILFAVYYNTTDNQNKKSNSSSYNMSVILPSGIFLGLAIFTKIPAITMIPLVGYLIISSAAANAANKNKHKNNNSKDNTSGSSSVITKKLRNIITNLRNLPNLKALGLWFIPVILIPAIWPIYAIKYGQLDEWLNDINWQTTGRHGSLFNSVNAIFEIDPVLSVLGIIGAVYATIRRDFFFLLWVLPYILFLYFVGYSQYIHMVPLIPLFSIATATLVEDLSNKSEAVISKRKIPIKRSADQKRITSYLGSDDIAPTQIPTFHQQKKNSRICFLALLALAIFGLENVSMLILTNVNSSFFESYAAIVKHIPDSSDTNDGDDKVTMIAARKWGIYYFWIPKYVFHKDLTYLNEKSKEIPQTEKVITVDGNFSKKDAEMTGAVLIGKVHNIARNYDEEKYPYTNMKYNEMANYEIRANY
jgi:hypothetical protein